MKNRLLYPLIRAAVTLLLLPASFLTLNGLWLIVRSLLWFGQGGSREAYPSAVLAHTPLWGISLGFLILSGFLALFLLLFSFSPPGKRFLSESSGIAAWLSEHVFLGMTMLVQLLAMLFGFSYRKESSSPEDKEETGFRATQEAAVREYEFPETLPDDYGQFLRRLARVRSEDAKIGYACRTLCRLYKKVVGNIAPSDTPKEVREKAVRSFPASDLDTARRIIERVKFAGNPPGEEEKTELLAELCRIVRILI